MDIAALQAFIAVARDKSFSKASERLFITQPAVSKRVAALEAELGVELFNRIARSVSLTEAGSQLLDKAQALVAQAEELQRFASNLDDEIAGNLTVSIAHHIGLYRMQPILRRFKNQFPKVHLDIRFEDSEQAFHSVEQGDSEFAVITLPKSLPTNIYAETVWHDELDIVVAQDHALAQSGRERLVLAELAQYPCVLTAKETETHQILQRLFAKNKLDLQVQMQTNSLETLKMLVGAGIGWSLLPTTMLSKERLNKAVLQQGISYKERLAEGSTTQITQSSLVVLDTGHKLKRELGLVLHSKRSLSNAAGALRELIRATE